MKKLALILALMSFAPIARAEDLRMAVCCIDYAVRNHPDFQALKRLSTNSPSKENDSALRQKEYLLRTKVREIVENLAKVRNYEWVFKVERTRKENVTFYHSAGMLISYSGDDISEEVAGLLSKTRAEQDGGGQPATRSESK
jgi:hypothetical protein